MTDLELKKLSRSDLLELLLEQAKEIERLRSELNQAKHELSERKIKLDKAGSIAEAALQVSGFFEAAQEACALYQNNVAQLYQRQEMICVQMEKDAQRRCDKMEQETRQKCDEMLSETKKLAEIYWNHFTPKTAQSDGIGMD